MKNAQKPDHISLNTLISRLREGRYVIPDFQRDFEWKPWDVRDLIRSIFLDYYIGSLLLWKGKADNFEALSCEHLYGFENVSYADHKSRGKPEHIVLDGQQRLTALHYALFAPEVPLPGRANQAAYYVQIDEFMAERYDQAFHYDWMSRKFTKILADTELQYQDHIFPVRVFGESGWALPNWVQGYIAYWEKAERAARDASEDVEAEHCAVIVENAKQFGELLKGLTDEYQLSYIELDEEIGLDKVCDIFTQINSKGVQLDVFDLINALLKPRGLQLRHMWRKASDKLEFVDSEKMNVYVLQVMSILRQAYCSPKYLYFLIPGTKKPVRDEEGKRSDEVLVRDTADFESLWEQAVVALEKAINTLRHPQEFGVISAKYIPYVSILPAFASLQHHASKLAPEIRLSAQRKIRHWYWASIFLNRYSGSVESTSARDFLAMGRWFGDELQEPDFVLDFKNRFRSLDLRREIRRGSSIYNGIFNLLVIQGARDWINGKVASSDDLDDHHIVPQSWGKTNLKKNAIDTILNRTPLSSDTNRNIIRDRLPNEYLPEWIAKNGEDSVRAILESHFISPAAFDILMKKNFSADDYEAFVSERNRTLMASIESLLVKDRLDLPADLRELDRQIEIVELDLRSVICTQLDNDWAKVPPHIAESVLRRVDAASRRNPAFDSEKYSELEGRLEFFDLRELQDTIGAKSLGPIFRERFGAKDALNQKFGQLAELRNGIRHSRTVSKVAQMEGEAAILWFGEILHLANADC